MGGPAELMECVWVALRNGWSVCGWPCGMDGVCVGGPAEWMECVCVGGPADMFLGVFGSLGLLGL